MIEIRKIEEPTVCPSCGSPVVRVNNAFVYCQNYECPEQEIGRLVNFVSKHGANIDGISEKTLRKLYEYGCKHWYDLYVLTPEQLREYGFGPNISLKICDEIALSCTNTSLENLLVALSIPMLGKVAAAELASVYKTVDNIFAASLEDIREKTTIGNVASESIYTAIHNEQMFSVERIKSIFDFTLDEFVISGGYTFINEYKGKNFLATGKLNNYSRDGIEADVKDCGGNYLSGVSKKLNYLIVGEKASTSKVDKAKLLGAVVITEDDYEKMKIKL